MQALVFTVCQLRRRSLWRRRRQRKWGFGYGNTGVGVAGSTGAGFAGIYGYNNDLGEGVYGLSSYGIGVYGVGATQGVYGSNTSGVGVYGSRQRRLCCGRLCRQVCFVCIPRHIYVRALQAGMLAISPAMSTPRGVSKFRCPA